MDESPLDHQIVRTMERFQDLGIGSNRTPASKSSVYPYAPELFSTGTSIQSIHTPSTRSPSSTEVSRLRRQVFELQEELADLREVEEKSQEEDQMLRQICHLMGSKIGRRVRKDELMELLVYYMEIPCLAKTPEDVAAEKERESAENRSKGFQRVEELEKMVQHFRHLFEVKHESGVFPRMTELYILLHEAKNMLRTIRSELDLPESASVDKCLHAISELKSKCERAKLLDQIQDSNYLSIEQNSTDQS